MKWSEDNDTSATRIESNVTANATYTATFAENAHVTLSYESSNATMGSVTLGSETVNPVIGSPLGSTAVANAGYEFVNWTVKGTTTVAGTNLILSKAQIDLVAKEAGLYVTKTFVANFREKAHVTLSYESSNITMGSVSPASETVNPVTGSPLGSTASANLGYEFVNWTVEGTEVGTDAVLSKTQIDLVAKSSGIYEATTFTANFREKAHVTLSYESSNITMGSVSPGSESLPPATGSATGSTASPNPGYEFVNWTVEGTEVGTDAVLIPEEVDAIAKSSGIYEATTFTANFKQKDNVTLSYVSSDATMGSVDPGSESLPPATGNAVGSTASANLGYEFVSWTVGDEVAGTDATLSPDEVDAIAKSSGIYVATTFTANFRIETIEIYFFKDWIDEEAFNQYEVMPFDTSTSSRPDSITINLLADGVEVDSVTIEPDEYGGWSGSFIAPKYNLETLEEIVYTLEEEKVDGYVTEIEEYQGEGFGITNIETITIPVNKVWIGPIGTEITVNLFAEMEPVLYRQLVESSEDEPVATLNLNEENDWANFFEVPRYTNYWQLIEYRIEEVSIDNYDSEIVQNQDGSFTITNTANKFTITYEDSMSDEIYDIQTISFGDIIIPIADPVKEGFIFAGWAPALPETMPANNLTVEAMWAGLDVEKSANKTVFSTLGEEITYTYKVTNKGNVTLSGPFTIVDDKIGTISTSSAPATLAPEASFTVEAVYEITQADLDAGFVTNAVRVTGNFGEEEVPGEDELTIPGKDTPLVSITKTANVTRFSRVGEKITYTITVKNTGNVTLTGIVVSDPMITLTGPSGDTNEDGNLDVGETWTYTGVYEVTSADTRAGRIVNTATVDTDQTNPTSTSLTILERTSGGGGGGGGDEEIIDEPIPEAVPELNKEDHFQYIQGYPNNTVRPEGLVTREEVAAVFYRLLTEGYRESIKTHSQSFIDVMANRWSLRHIATLANGGIIEGYPDGSFRPGNFITRAELATIASRFDNLSPFVSNSFSDIEGHWANRFINSASVKGWVNGYPDGTFKPNQFITRAEFVTLVNNVLERRVHKEDILPESRQFPDLNVSAWYYEAMQESINSHHYLRLPDTYEEWIDIYYPILDM